MFSYIFAMIIALTSGTTLTTTPVASTQNSAIAASTPSVNSNRMGTMHPCCKFDQ